MDENSFVRSFFVDDNRSSNDYSFATEADFFAEYPMEQLAELKADNDLFEPLDPIVSTPMLQKTDFYQAFPSSPAFELRGPQLATQSNFYDAYSPHQPNMYQNMMQPHSYMRVDLSKQQPLQPQPVIPILRSQSAPQPLPMYPPMKPMSTTMQLGKVPVQRSVTAPTTNREYTNATEPAFKSKGKRCNINGCTRRAQSNNRCKAHGGGARCQFQGCPKSSQGGGFCRAHGGGKKCEFEGCTKGQQRKGFCYAHGGIRKCKEPNCDKKDRGNGYCISHGGGKRCNVAGCLNAVRKGRFCRVHLVEDD